MHSDHVECCETGYDKAKDSIRKETEEVNLVSLNGDFWIHEEAEKTVVGLRFIISSFDLSSWEEWQSGKYLCSCPWWNFTASVQAILWP